MTEATMSPGDEASPKARSYDQILKSTALIGASSLINIGFSILRVKVFAVLLGPAGIGLFGLYSSLLELAQTLAGLGVQTSGVRQIADAQGAGDERRISVTIEVVRRVSLGLALLGAAGFAIAAPFVLPTWEEGAYVVAAMLCVALALRTVAGGQAALIQGKRRIGDLARLNTIGAAASTLASIPLVYWWGPAGIAPSLVVMAAVSLLASWWYSRRIGVEDVRIAWPEFRNEARALLALGIIFMVSGVLTLASGYAVRLIVLEHEGLLAAGLYQAAWTIGGLYASFILQAMGADFYPRLTAICHDDQACNQLVNEQVQVSILLAGPGVLATLTLAPLILTALYSSAFLSAVDLLRWVCLGMMLRILAWPLGYIMVARAAQKAFFWTEVAATVVHVGLAWILVDTIGIAGAGMAFFGLYVWHGAIVYLLVRRMSGFRWSPGNLRLIALFTGSAMLLMAAFATLPLVYAATLGALATVSCGLYALRMLVGLTSAEFLPPKVRAMARRLAFA